jgi:hypothetical protein
MRRNGYSQPFFPSRFCLTIVPSRASPPFRPKFRPVLGALLPPPAASSAGVATWPPPGTALGCAHASTHSRIHAFTHTRIHFESARACSCPRSSGASAGRRRVLPRQARDKQLAARNTQAKMRCWWCVLQRQAHHSPPEERQRQRDVQHGQHRRQQRLPPPKRFD